jgi:hypothetical protein
MNSPLQSNRIVDRAELESRLRSGLLTTEQLQIAAFFGDPAARLIVNPATPWPPPDVHVLYRWGWNEMRMLGKEACLRAALAAFEVFTAGQQPDDYDRQALNAAEDWVLDPSESNRKSAGRVASVVRPKYSTARTLANMAGARNHWRLAVGIMVAGNPHATTPAQFDAICQRLHAELVPWALRAFDAVADRRRQRDRRESELTNGIPQPRR